MGCIAVHSNSLRHSWEHMFWDKTQGMFVVSQGEPGLAAPERAVVRVEMEAEIGVEEKASPGLS